MVTNMTSVTEEEIAAGARASDGKRIIDHTDAEDVAEAFHATFDENMRELMEPVRDTLLESVESCTPEEIIGQLLMNLLGDGDEDWSDGRLTVELKERLVRIASHMGPDWAQALYHAAVFITKVA